ncbi:testis-expressed sequence 11 [Labeo rohita]|uniref:Protein ZIP4 homolog n=1 Tax=Labeo rohita TaxID=84645 RepID=A0A498LPW2_LABRO|nr:testis-expressed sequence 11 [Labeo rohita]
MYRNMEQFVVDVKNLSEKLLHRETSSDLDEVIETLFKAISTLDGAAKLQDSQSLETLYSKLTSNGDCAADINTPKGDIEKDLLRVLSYQAESFLKGNIKRQFHAYSDVKKCFFVFLKSQSYDTGKMNVKYSPGSEMQAKVLRLLAKVYLEWDCQKYLEKALHAVSLANKEHMQLSGLYLKISILVKSHSPDDAVKSGLSELLNSEVPLEVCLNIVKLLVEENREALAFDFLKRVCQHFESSPDLGSALLMHIELLLQRDKELLAKQKIEDAITGHYTGKQLAPQTLSSLHLLLWDRASKNFEAKNYSEALQWYNYSLSFYRAGELDQNLAKLQRNRASCFLHLQQLEKAKEAIEAAARVDPTNIFTQFNIYKIAVLENNAEKAAVALREIGALAQNPVTSEERLLVTENAAANLLSLAAQIALETELLTQTLEHIQLCKEICTTIKASGTSSKDKTDTLLLLYEFEVRAKLNDPKLESVFESVLELDHMETKLLEIMAVLAMEPPAHFPVLCKKALRIALSLHRKQPQVDFTRCSNCLHSLIQLTLPSGVSEVQPCVLEEVWGYYEEALSIIATAPEDFPELEILWLLTRAWNMGIQLYSLAHYPEAERWCGLGMSFLKHLGSLQDSYQTQMVGLYSEVLDRLDKAKKNLIIEE